MSHRRARLSLLAAAVAAGVVVPAVGAAPGAIAAPGAVTGPTVTLVTGDQVTLGGAHGVRVRAAQGREQVGFYARKDERGDTHVIPGDAIALLSKGKLDPRLFDVTALVKAGYDDASRGTLPLIVDYAGPTPRGTAGVEASRELPAIGSAAVAVRRSADFWATARDAEHVWLDGPVRMSLDHSVPQIGAPEAWAAGHTGEGTTVAVLDTGIDVTHPDLADAVVGAKNFTNSTTDDDRVGHGTHVASTITGSGAASGGKYQGVAPDAKLLNGKVLDDRGNGRESWIIAGMEWAAASGVDVVNMSLGSDTPSDGTDPVSQAVNRLTADTGTLFVIAAGNNGKEVGSPAAADAALAVGAVDGDDQLADFSSRGSIAGAIKPDITAPGVDIVAARAKNGTLGEPVDANYTKASGTSMATPHVAGAAAILAGEHPDWTPGQLKATLMGTAKPTAGLSVFEQGAGRVDVAKAVTATVSASPASVSLGTQQWPHTDDQPAAKTLTYTNTGTEPLTLDLAADVTGPNGSRAPQGMFVLSPAQLTIPAGGQASTTFTSDTRVAAPDGQYGGAVTATGGGQTVRTPVAVNREIESYDVTLHFVNHNGVATDDYDYRFVDLKTPTAYDTYDRSGTVTVRLPKGEYYFEAVVQTPTTGFQTLDANVAEPALKVTRNTTMTIDARAAKPVGFTVDKPNAKPGSTMLQFARITEWGDTGTTWFGTNFDNALVTPATTAKKRDFTFTAEARMAEWNGSTFNNSPYLYNLRHTDNRTVPSTLVWTVHDRQLARVNTEHAAATPGMNGLRESFLFVALPSTLTEFYTPDTPWETRFDEVAQPWSLPVSSVYQAEPVTYHLGRARAVRWNVGVYGPALPVSPYGTGDMAGREGELMGFFIPVATDQGRGRMSSTYASGTTTLLRGNEVVATTPRPGSGVFTVPPERATYTLRTTVTRSSAALSTQIGAEWTFSSEYRAELVDLPLLALRFAPDLDDHNAAPAGERFTIPLFVERNNTHTVGRVDTPGVEVSYDDGVTWQAAKVRCTHDRWEATVSHPAGAKFVSLRGTVRDRAGNTEKVTIIRAYALT
jgi:subtilisin family serine protease